jgi:microcompartment protein CcmL/EutN
MGDNARAARLDTIGLLEVSSIGRGFAAEDAMLKAAEVELLLARTICSGKYLVVIAGDVASVQASMEAGEDAVHDGLIESRIIPRLHPSVFPAISQSVEIDPESAEALGIVETFSAAAIVEAADAAAKAASVTLFRIHLAMALGGKGFLLMTGDVGSVKAGVEAGARVAGSEGMLVSKVVIPSPPARLFQESL